MKRVNDLNNPAHLGHSNHLISTNGKKAQRVQGIFPCLSTEIRKQLTLDWNRTNKEQCGFIDSDQNIWYIPNIHEEPTHNFYMEIDGSMKALNSIFNGLGIDVIGIFHTHPNNVPWPSPRDIAGWPDERLGWRYFIVVQGEVIEWELVNDDG